MSQMRTAGLFALLAVIWGISFMAIKADLLSLPPILFAAVRYDVAGIVMLGYAFVTMSSCSSRPQIR